MLLLSAHDRWRELVDSFWIRSSKSLRSRSACLSWPHEIPGKPGSPSSPRSRGGPFTATGLEIALHLEEKTPPYFAWRNWRAWAARKYMAPDLERFHRRVTVSARGSCRESGRFLKVGLERWFLAVLTPKCTRRIGKLYRLIAEVGAGRLRSANPHCASEVNARQKNGIAPCRSQLIGHGPARLRPCRERLHASESGTSPPHSTGLVRSSLS